MDGSRSALDFLWKGRADWSADRLAHDSQRAGSTRREAGSDVRSSEAVWHPSRGSGCGLKDAPGAACPCGRLWSVARAWRAGAGARTRDRLLHQRRRDRARGEAHEGSPRRKPTKEAHEGSPRRKPTKEILGPCRASDLSAQIGWVELSKNRSTKRSTHGQRTVDLARADAPRAETGGLRRGAGRGGSRLRNRPSMPDAGPHYTARCVDHNGFTRFD